MAEQTYEYGYKYGIMLAEYYYQTWQLVGPPFPWPRTTSDIPQFVEDCLPGMHFAIYRRVREQALSDGVPREDLNNVFIPRTVIEGVEDGFRTRFTQLLQEFVRR